MKEAKGAKQSKQSPNVRPGNEFQDSLNSSVISSETELIQNTAYAFFGSTLGSNERAYAAAPGAVRENPMHHRRMPNRSLAAAQPLNLSERSASSEVDAKSDMESSVNRPSSWLSESSSGKSNVTLSGRNHNSVAGIRQRKRGRRRRKRESRRSRAEWEHESLARLLYGGPPAADGGGDRKDISERQHQRDERALRASYINNATVGARPHHIWWNASDDEFHDATGNMNENALKSVTEESPSFDEEALTEGKPLLEKINEDTKNSLSMQDRKVQSFELHTDYNDKEGSSH